MSPATISSHLHKKHKTQLELRKQVDRYIERCPFEYNHLTVKLPADRLGLQLIVKVVDGFYVDVQTRPRGGYDLFWCAAESGGHLTRGWVRLKFRGGYDFFILGVVSSTEAPEDRL